MLRREYFRFFKHFRKILFMIFRKMNFIFIEYPLNLRPRYGLEKPVHKDLNLIVSRNKHIFKKNIQDFKKIQSQLREIDFSEKSTLPFWNNNYFQPFDAITLYSMIVNYKPKNYFEIGSGESTKFVRKAIKDFNTLTKITSIDPLPTTKINSICDLVIRKTLEEVDLDIFKTLGKGDVLFLDGSHRVFMNSDVTIFFLEIFPYLKKGVIIHFHDIFIPFDYPKDFADRYFSEQYMLATILLSKPNNFNILMSNFFITKDESLSKQVAELLTNLNLNRSVYGSSFWIMKK